MSDNRGYIEAITGLLAVFLVAVGISLFAGILTETPDQETRLPVTATLEQTVTHYVDGGAIDPQAIDNPSELAPPGYDVRVIVKTQRQTWIHGETAPPTAVSAARSVGVRVAPGTYRAGTLRVEVWNA